MLECIDKNRNIFFAYFSEADVNGSVDCRVYNKEYTACVDTFRIKSSEMGLASKEMIAQKRVYATAY